MPDLITDFGGEADAIWEEVASELGAEYDDQEGWRHDKVRVRRGNWTVTLDFTSHAGYRSSALYTRLRAPYVNPEGFSFALRQEGLFQDVAKLLGVQDVTLGDPAFDEAFLIKANDEARVKALFASATLRQRMLAEPKLTLALENAAGVFAEEHPGGVDALVLELPGRVERLDRLRAVFEIFSEVLSVLCGQGSAYDTGAA